MKKVLCVSVGVFAIVAGYFLYRQFTVVPAGWQHVVLYVEGEQGDSLDAYVAALQEKVRTLCVNDGVEVKKVSTQKWEMMGFAGKSDTRGTELHIWVFIPFKDGVAQAAQAEKFYEALVRQCNGQWRDRICCRHTDMDVYEDSRFLHTAQCFYMASSPADEEKQRKEGWPVNLGLSLQVMPAD